jgi:hypothetical protein
MHHLARALEDGAKKYGPFNWRTHPISSSTYRSARLRHDDAYWDGEDVASDSKIHHLAHLMACCAIEIDALELGMLVDDRPPKGSSARLQSDYVANKALSQLTIEARSLGLYETPCHPMSAESLRDEYSRDDNSTGV